VVTAPSSMAQRITSGSVCSKGGEGVLTGSERAFVGDGPSGANGGHTRTLSRCDGFLGRLLRIKSSAWLRGGLTARSLR
jgi:hypothetical protein